MRLSVHGMETRSDSERKERQATTHNVRAWEVMNEFINLVPVDDDTVFAPGGILLRELLVRTLHDLSLGKTIHSFRKEKNLEAMHMLWAKNFNHQVYCLFMEMWDTWVHEFE
jgi:hypothetical protein